MYYLYVNTYIVVDMHTQCFHVVRCIFNYQVCIFVVHFLVFVNPALDSIPVHETFKSLLKGLMLHVFYHKENSEIVNCGAFQIYL